MNSKQINRSGQVYGLDNRQIVKIKNGKKGEPLKFRPFRETDSDYEAIAAIENANYADSPMTVNEYRYHDESWDKKYMRDRVVTEVNGRILGFATYGQPWWAFKEGSFFVFINVHPDWHDSDTAAALLDYATKALEAQQPEQLISEFREDQRYLVDLLAPRGYEAVMRYPISELKPQQFDAAPFAALCDRVKASAVCIDDLQHVAETDQDWQHKLWELESELLKDIPTPDPLTSASFEQWQKRVLESPNFLIDGHFIARDGERFVGLSALWASQGSPQKLYTGLTGVVRSHRRQGIATALKVQGILFAQALGIDAIETDNEENNPMLDINKQLGFYEKPAYVSYKKITEIGEPTKELLKEPM